MVLAVAFRLEPQPQPRFVVQPPCRHRVTRTATCRCSRCTLFLRRGHCCCCCNTTAAACCLTLGFDGASSSAAEASGGRIDPGGRRRMRGTDCSTNNPTPTDVTTEEDTAVVGG